MSRREGKSLQFVVRFPEDLGLEVDRITKRLQASSSGVRVTRSDAIRFLVRLGIERDGRQKKSGKRRS